jgi:hypothetical protein
MKHTLQITSRSQQKLMQFLTLQSDRWTTNVRCSRQLTPVAKKTIAGIVTMIAALSDVFCTNLPKAICETYKLICTKEPNMVLLHMFDWFTTKYGKTTASDHEENWKRMATGWHLSNSLSSLQRSSSLTHHTQEWYLTQWKTVTSSTLACTSSSAVA